MKFFTFFKVKKRDEVLIRLPEILYKKEKLFFSRLSL
jgi:hypothetical protein